MNLYRSRLSTDRWSILPPFFQIGLFNPELDVYFGKYFDGTLEPFPSIIDVDEVLVPLHIKNVHWFLGVFNLVQKTLTIYDRYIQEFNIINC